MSSSHRLGYGLLFLAGVMLGQTHFIPVDSTGLPYLVIIEPDSTAFYILQAGDEIGLFDDTLCVGADTYSGNGNFPITAWEGSPDYGLSGFTAGDSITIRLWTDMGNGFEEYLCLTDFSVGDGTYGYGSYSVCTMDILDTTVVSIHGEAQLQPVGFQLEQNYPNPFNAVTTIRFTVTGERVPLSLTIVDINGQEVARILQRALTPGAYSVLWDASEVSSGIYFSRLNDRKNQIVKKMVVLK